MNAGRPRRAALAVLAALLVAGCAVRPTVPGSSVGWDARARALVAVEAWTLRGRIAVRGPEGGGQGRVEWRQAPDDTRIRVSGPFGAGAVEIAWDATRVVVFDGSGEVATAYEGPAAIDAFVAAELGFPFPAGSVRYWALGVPAPGPRARQRFGPDGWLQSIEQGGVRVDYQGFVRRDGYWLPRKVTVEDARGRVRLVIDEWFTRAG